MVSPIKVLTQFIHECLLRVLPWPFLIAPQFVAVLAMGKKPERFALYTLQTKTGCLTTEWLP